MSLRAKAYIDFENIYYSYFPYKEFGYPEDLYHQGASEKRELENRYKGVIKCLKERIESIVSQINSELGTCGLGLIEAFADFEEFIGAQRILDDEGIRPTYVRKFKKDYGVIHNAVDMKMTASISSEVNDYDVFIVALADKDYRMALETLRQAVKRIGVIGVENITPPRILVGVQYYRALKIEELRPSVGIKVKAPPQLPPKNFLYRAIMLRAYHLMLDNGWPMIHIDKLIEAISSHTWFKELSKPDWYDYVNAARDDKVITLYQKMHGSKTITFFTPNYISYLWAQIFIQLDKVISAIEEDLKFEKWAKENWVPISVITNALEWKLGKELADHPTEREGKSEDSERQSIKRDINLWLKLFTEEDLLRTEVRKNPDPNKPPTRGFLPPSATPSWLKFRIPLSEELQHAALILTVISFFERNNTDWISVNNLKGLLEKFYGSGYVIEMLKWAEVSQIFEYCELEYQGRQISAYRLNQQADPVKEILGKRDRIMGIVNGLMVDREDKGVDVELLVDRLKEEGISENVADLRIWLVLLRNGQRLWTDLHGKIVKPYTPLT
jgi:hypothetical protein